MTPQPQGCTGSVMVTEPSQPPNGETIVISGMSGMFPMSSSVKDLSTILYNKVNPVNSDDIRWTMKHPEVSEYTGKVPELDLFDSQFFMVNPVNSDDIRWTMKHPEVSEYTGKVPELDRFDSQFFMVHNRLGNSMDPMARKILEHSYQAIYDAGISPKQLKGKKVGVYIGSGFSDMESNGMIDLVGKTGYGITGCSKSMYANRISYWLDAKGPSVSVDNACCSSTVALEEAYTAINSGSCEAAIVGGTNLYLAPYSMLYYSRCIKISPDGTTKSFDENAAGCTKSEAISVVFLQKVKNAVRAYAELVHVKNEFVSNLSNASGQMFGFVRNPDTTATFLKQFYAETGVSPNIVKYIEVCGSADLEADKTELQTIEKVFIGNRTDPILVGSVASNIGFTDAASGVTALTKVLLGYHNGLIAGNLHCSNPRKDITAIQEGRMSIVTDHEPFDGTRTYAALNLLSITGVNSHALLRGYSKPKDLSRYTSPIPRLVTLSSRQKDFLEPMFMDLKSRPIDAEEHALFHNIHCTNISGHLGRGYIILDTDEKQNTVSLSEKMEFSEETNRPLWFVYSGMGSQWAGMGAQLMRIPIFADAIERCHKVLAPKGIDIVNIITSEDKTIFDNVLNSFVGIASIQIGLTDILTALELRPEKVIGHSVGELGCAYADGCLTAEEMILSAYSRGQASNETPLIRGAMAAVGLGYNQLQKICPSDIDIACHNSSTSSTISGPEESIRTLVENLTADSVFAKEVPCANIAYHSRYIADAGPNLIRLLSDIIQEPKPRSERWLSTSVPQEKWEEPIAKYCSPEYLTNNLLSPVLFEETSELIPSNAVLIEIAPHGLLQAILKRSLPESCNNVPLTRRGHTDNALFLLNSIGQLYIEGYTPRVQALYPKVEFPVSTGTPHLGHHGKWNHSEKWIIKPRGFHNGVTKVASFCKFLINPHEDEHIYLRGNVVQDKILYPFAGALVAVWDTMVMAMGLEKKKVSVRFTDVHLYSQPIVHYQKQLRLNVSVNKGNGQFEVLDGDFKLATGSVFTAVPSELEPNDICSNFPISSDEIYEHFSSRGYSYKDSFRSIHSANEPLTNAQLIWDNNWVTMLDGLLQLNDLRQTHKGVSQPTQFRELVIDVEEHIKSTKETLANGQTVIQAKIDEILDWTRCGGVILNNVTFRNIPSMNQGKFKLITDCGSDKEVKNNDVQIRNGNITTDKIVALQISNVGDLDNLYWRETSIPSGSGIKVKVEYAGINVIDMKRASGIIPFGEEGNCFGIDFSGLTERGERVMGLVRNGAARTMVTALPELLWPVPAHWSLEEAATVPLAFVQAIYYLCVKKELQKGWKVLIHGAAGALGQAAISVALAHGCQVFATVADSAKKQFLLKLFPQLNEDFIGNSRDDNFGEMVIIATNGKGCEIVLSCVKEDLKNMSLKCTAFSGVTIDLLQIPNRDKYEYGMSYMTKQRSYVAADFYSVLDSGNQTELRKLQNLLSDGIARGFVRPLSRVTYASHEVPRAFQLLAASRHRGRVLLQLRDSSTRAIPRIVCEPTRSHLIFWDGSSFGLQLAERLIARGVTKLRIYCLKSTSKRLLILRLWKKAGVDVEIYSDVLANSSNVLELINETIKLGPIEGIYVTTGAVSDYNNNESIDLATIINHLDRASRKLCSDLKYFAVISIDNNIGQETCLSRSKHGLPATLLNLPAFMNANNGKFLGLSSWNQSAADVTETALLSKHSVLSAEPQPAEQLDLIKLIAAKAEREDENATLNELGLADFVPFIKLFLSDVYHILLEDEEVLRLTRKRILEIEMNSTERILQKRSGLDVFFSYVDFDELQATTDFIRVDSLLPYINTSWSGEGCLFVIPGLEGHHERFRSLCERLKVPTIVLQPGLDWPQETPQELAVRYSKVLLKKLKLKKKFMLIGYEFGIVAALELASILEEHGLTGTVYCLGDGPEEMKALLNSELRAFKTKDALQMEVVRHMYALMAPGSPLPAENALNECSSWRERVDTFVRLLHGVSYTAQYARGLLEAAYGRIETARHYSIIPRTLRSRIVLLRAQHHSGEECSLQRFTNSSLNVQDLAMPISHVATDLQVPAIINRYLDDEVLQIYEISNLCQPYAML